MPTLRTDLIAAMRSGAVRVVEVAILDCPAIPLFESRDQVVTVIN